MLMGRTADNDEEDQDLKEVEDQDRKEEVEDQDLKEVFNTDQEKVTRSGVVKTYCCSVRTCLNIPSKGCFNCSKHQCRRASSCPLARTKGNKYCSACTEGQSEAEREAKQRSDYKRHSSFGRVHAQSLSNTNSANNLSSAQVTQKVTVETPDGTRRISEVTTSAANLSTWQHDHQEQDKEMTVFEQDEHASHSISTEQHIQQLEDMKVACKEKYEREMKELKSTPLPGSLLLSMVKKVVTANPSLVSLFFNKSYYEAFLQPDVAHIIKCTKCVRYFATNDPVPCVNLDQLKRDMRQSYALWKAHNEEAKLGGFAPLRHFSDIGFGAIRNSNPQRRLIYHGNDEVNHHIVDTTTTSSTPPCSTTPSSLRKPKPILYLEAFAQHIFLARLLWEHGAALSAPDFVQPNVSFTPPRVVAVKLFQFKADKPSYVKVLPFPDEDSFQSPDLDVLLAYVDIPASFEAREKGIEVVTLTLRFADEKNEQMPDAICLPDVLLTVDVPLSLALAIPSFAAAVRPKMERLLHEHLREDVSELEENIAAVRS